MTVRDMRLVRGAGGDPQRTPGRPGAPGLLPDAPWTTRAACAGTDPDQLFVTGAAQREAARVCTTCPVRLECLADALDSRTEFGVWGGLTERQRRALLRRRPEVTSWRVVLEDARREALGGAAS